MLTTVEARRQPYRVVTELWELCKGAKYFCIAVKPLSGKWTERFFEYGEWVKVRRFIRANRKSNLYFCPHGFSAKSRKKEYAVKPPLLWSDLDETDPRKLKIKPTVAIETSPGRYAAFWVTDKPATEELNRRLTYYIEADNSGWDWSQVLRVPGTTNYKPEYKKKLGHHPEGKVLWSLRKKLRITNLENRIPSVKKLVGVSSDDVTEVLKRYQSRLGPDIRQFLMRKTVMRGDDRSEILWKYINELLEKGLTSEEVFTLVWGSPYNKHREAHNGEDRLLSEIDKAQRMHLASPPKVEKSDVPKEDTPFTAENLALTKMKHVEWIIEPLFCKGELTLVDGDGGLGKSAILQYLAVRFLNKETLPPCFSYGRDIPETPRILYFDNENKTDSVLKPRLIAAGLKDLSSYKVISNSEGELIDIQDPICFSRICRTIEQEKPHIVFFDPIQQYIGNANMNDMVEANSFADKFVQLAERYKIAVVVVRHRSKSAAGGKAQNSGGGSTGITARARINALVNNLHRDDDEDPDMRYFAITKLNNARKPPVFGYKVEGAEVTYEGEVFNTGRVVYSGIREDLDEEKVNAGSKHGDFIRGGKSKANKEVNVTVNASPVGDDVLAKAINDCMQGKAQTPWNLIVRRSTKKPGITEEALIHRLKSMPEYKLDGAKKTNRMLRTTGK